VNVESTADLQGYLERAVAGDAVRSLVTGNEPTKMTAGLRFSPLSNPGPRPLRSRGRGYFVADVVFATVGSGAKTYATLNSCRNEAAGFFYRVNAMSRLLLPVVALLVLSLIGMGVYALIAGQIPLIRGTIQGPLARIVGLLLILFTIMGIPVLLRALVGMSMSLGH
jgi:hypothetical protein